MKAVVILFLVVVVVALVAVPAGAALQAKLEQARASRIEEQARMELARADAYAVRSQANQPMLLAVTGIVLAMVMIGGLAVVLVGLRPSPVPTSSQPTPTMQVHVVMIGQLPGESRPEYLRRIEASSQEYAFPLVLDARPRVEAGRSLDRPAG